MAKTLGILIGGMFVGAAALELADGLTSELDEAALERGHGLRRSA